jgi:NADH:ubiquinone oxidoreductase subunit E
MKEDLLDRVEHAAYRQAIVRGDKDLIKMLLVAKRQADYAPRASLNLNVDVTKLTDEELDELITKHSKRSG